MPLAACGDDDEGGTTITETLAAITSEAAPTVSDLPEASSASTAATAETVPTGTTQPVEATETAAATDPAEATEPTTTISGGDLGESPLRLTAADLPGYEEVPYESEAADCLGPALDASAAISIAPNAFRPADESSEVRSRTWSYADEAEATAAFATATGPEVTACITEGAEARLQSEDYEPGGGVTRSELALPALAGADEQDGAQYVATYTPKGGSDAVSGYADLVVVRVGGTVAAYQFLASGAPFPAAQEQAAVGAAVARGAAAG